jgi:hypothetical protein
MPVMHMCIYPGWSNQEFICNRGNIYIMGEIQNGDS